MFIFLNLIWAAHHITPLSYPAGGWRWISMNANAHIHLVTYVHLGPYERHNMSHLNTEQAHSVYWKVSSWRWRKRAATLSPTCLLHFYQWTKLLRGGANHRPPPVCPAPKGSSDDWHWLLNAGNEQTMTVIVVHFHKADAAETVRRGTMENNDRSIHTSQLLFSSMKWTLLQYKPSYFSFSLLKLLGRYSAVLFIYLLACIVFNWCQWRFTHASVFVSRSIRGCYGNNTTIYICVYIYHITMYKSLWLCSVFAAPDQWYSVEMGPNGS